MFLRRSIHPFEHNKCAHVRTIWGHYHREGVSLRPCEHGQGGGDGGEGHLNVCVVVGLVRLLKAQLPGLQSQDMSAFLILLSLADVSNTSRSDHLNDCTHFSRAQDTTAMLG